MSKFVDLIIKQEAIVAAATTKLAELRAAADAYLLVAEVAPGYVVEFKIGRADTRRTVKGIVRGRGIVKDVDSVRAEVGEGFDLEVFTIPVSQLLSIAKPGIDLSNVTPELDSPASDEQAGVLDAAQAESDALLAELNG